MSIIDNLKNKKIEIAIKEGFNAVILERLSHTKKQIEADKKELELKHADLIEYENKIKKRIKSIEK